MRVLHLVRSLEIGGLEKVVADLIVTTVERGIECHLGCLLEKGVWVDGLPVESVWVGRSRQRGRLAAILGLRRHVMLHGIDLIHSHNPEPHVFGAAAALFSGKPLIHTKHGRNYPDDRRRVWLNRQLARATRKIVAVSEDAAKVATEIEGVPAEKVVVIRNGVAIPDGVSGPDGGTSDVRREMGIGKDAFVVGSVGRFSPEKNYQVLIQAFSRFRKSDARGQKSVALLLVGDGPERSALEKLAAELGLTGSVHMPGMKDDVMPYLEAMDVFCLSSVTEGTSVTLLEAGASGLPSVVTDVGGNAEVVEHGKTGLVVAGGDEDGIASAFAQILEDAGKRKSLGTNARKRIAERYNLHTMVSEYVRVYNEALRLTD